MERRTFLAVLGVGSYGGLAWLIEACSSDGSIGAPTVSAQPSASSPKPSPSTVTGPKGPPTDQDEYVPGTPDAGSSPVVQNPASTLPNPSWESRVKQLEGGMLYTEDAPGPWAGKERSHVPTIIADTMLTNRVTVLVNHVMQVGGPVDGGGGGGMGDGGGGGNGDGGGGGMADAGDGGVVDAAPPGPTILPQHYVTTIYVKTDTGLVAGLVEFAPTDPAPPSVTFVLPPGTKSATAYEYCNIHGLWASKPLAVKA